MATCTETEDDRPWFLAICCAAEISGDVSLPSLLANLYTTAYSLTNFRLHKR
jgi:hypothetical protein